MISIRSIVCLSVLVLILAGCGSKAQQGGVVGGLTGALVGSHVGPDDDEHRLENALIDGRREKVRSRACRRQNGQWELVP